MIYLAHVMVHFGGWLFEGTNAPELSRIIRDAEQTDRHKALEATFNDSWVVSPRGAMIDNWADVVSRLGDLDPSRRVEPDTLKALIQAHLADRMQVTKAVIDAALPAARDAAFSQAEEGQHLFLSLLWATGTIKTRCTAGRTCHHVKRCMPHGHRPLACNRRRPAAIGRFLETSHVFCVSFFINTSAKECEMSCVESFCIARHF
ncbi:hypothetical protein [Parasulfitobacter algicola]|uniref:Uncharacterized protein n=1 Tax=Parasulfitobacter algicola TaxID=2614809 RepID=A0ABX2IWQ7_9RHOB|nr:hypothetical protein [Sulfitobacter algicola]NSX57060.1 hypothetical protein [Sulfitobacter algicola]